jgi:Protein of unknown function (DUF3750)
MAGNGNGPSFAANPRYAILDPTDPTQGKKMRRRMTWLWLTIAVWTLAPVALSALRYTPPAWAWHEAPNDSTGLAPDPAATRDAIVQIYAARAFAWRGIFATHPWIVVKRAGAQQYTRYDVVGWGAAGKLQTNYGLADGKWYGATPDLLLDLRGEKAAAAIERVLAAIETYPYRNEYRTWPGPNSNTFLAHVAREVPELNLDLPANAIGKDYRPLGNPIGRAPSGGGVQISLLGLAGITLAPEEGIEFNLLGLSFGLDVLEPAIRLPVYGRLGMK